MSYVGKVLWACVDAKANPKPYLCVDEDVVGFMLSLTFVDLEYADILTIFESDVNALIIKGGTRWDDQGG